jgi:hypothetical protein
MSHQQDPWEQDSSDPAEAFLRYVGVAGVALTALVALGLVVGLLVVFVPMNEAIGTVVFGGLLLGLVYGISQYGESGPR